jgi:hypothetical protein
VGTHDDRAVLTPRRGVGDDVLRLADFGLGLDIEADPCSVGLVELLAQREPFYRQADVLLICEQRSPREVAQHVAHQFRLANQKAPAPHPQ